MMASAQQVRARRRRAAVYQCGRCRRMWALQVVRSSVGAVVRCRHCGAEHPLPSAADRRSS